MTAASDRMREAAGLLRKGAPIPTECAQLSGILAAVLDQEAIWAEDTGDRYPADRAPVLLLADAVVAGANV